MAITVFERTALKEFANDYVKHFKKAVYKKKVARRRTMLPTRFSAVVNSTGNLAESIKYKISKNGELTFTTAEYLYWLIYGRKPETKRPPISAIEAWMKTKGIKTDKEDKYGVSPWAIANSIAKKGSSIYRNYKGEPSSLLSSIPVDDLLDHLYVMMGEGYVQTINFSILQNLNNEELNLEL